MYTPSMSSNKKSLLMSLRRSDDVSYRVILVAMLGQGNLVGVDLIVGFEADLSLLWVVLADIII